jgi:hypothetical protein
MLCNRQLGYSIYVSNKRTPTKIRLVKSLKKHLFCLVIGDSAITWWHQMDIAPESSRYGSLTAQIMRRRFWNGTNGGASINRTIQEE